FVHGWSPSVGLQKEPPTTFEGAEIVAAGPFSAMGAMPAFNQQSFKAPVLSTTGPAERALPLEVGGHALLVLACAHAGCQDLSLRGGERRRARDDERQPADPTGGRVSGLLDGRRRAPELQLVAARVDRHRCEDARGERGWD